MKYQVLPVCLIVLGMGQSLWAKPHLETYGDSITAGFLTHTNVTHAPPLPVIGQTISNLAMYLMDKEKNRSYVEKEHAPHLAWPAKLAAQLDPAGPLDLYNYAVSSSRTWEMAAQVRGNKHPSGETIAFFFIGHNDVCNNLDTPKNIGAQFASDFADSLAEWEKTHTASTAYLIPVADIHRVYATLDGYVWYKGKKNYTCADSWTKFFPYCPSHYKKQQLGLLEPYMKPRIAAMNAELDRLALEWTKKSRKNRYVYLKDAHDTPYQKDYFAVDCFHLSETGQQTVADRLIEMLQADGSL